MLDVSLVKEAIPFIYWIVLTNRRWAELSLEEEQYHEPQYLTKPKLETHTEQYRCV